MQMDEQQQQLLDRVKQAQAKETEFPKDLRWKHVIQIARAEEKSSDLQPDQVYGKTLAKVANQLTKTRRKYDSLREDLAKLEQEMAEADQLKAAKLSVKFLSTQAELNDLVKHYNGALPQLTSELISYISKTSTHLNQNLHEDHRKVSEIATNL